MTFEPAAAWAHIDYLADRHEVVVRVIKKRSAAEAHPSSRQIWVPEMRNPKDYVTALHELGHVVSPQSRRPFKRLKKRETLMDRMLCEAAAWAWAKAHISPDVVAELDEATRRYIGLCLESHLDNCP